MNDRNHPDESIEMRLDRLIDALNAGLPLSGFASDPELRELADTVRATDSVRETVWPDAGFGKRMAARLSAELRQTHPTIGPGRDARLFDLPEAPARLNGRVDLPTPDAGSSMLDLTVPRRDSRLKFVAQMAAGLAGFALLTFVLVTVFRGAPEDDNVGVAPPDSTASTLAFATASPTTAASGTATGAGDQSAVAPATPPSTPNASIAIVPYELTCSTSAAVTGSGFVPGARVDILIGDRVPDAPDGSAVASIEADENGSFEFTELVPASTLIPNCEQRAAEGGSELVFSASSIIEVDGEQRYAQPAASTPVMLNPVAGAPELPDVPESTAATLTLTPDIVPCGATVTASGAGFEPGTQLTFFAVHVPSDNGVALDAHPEVGAGGTFSAELDISQVTPCGEGAQLPATGIVYHLSAMTGTGPKPDGDDWRAPAAEAVLTVVADAASASPEAVEQAMVDQAVAAAREFLGDPEARFDLVEVQRGLERYVRISRDIDGAYDEFTYDVGWQRMTSATLQSQASGWSPSAPVDADQAMQIAAEIASASLPFFEQLTLYETNDLGTLPGRDGQQDRIFTAIWQLQTNTQTPVWLPTVLQVNVDMETGLVTGYHFSDKPYFGPLEPAVPEADAIAAVEGAIATEPTLTGATIGKVELATSYQVLELDENGAVTSGEWVLVWRVHLADAPDTAPAPYIEVDGLTGEILTEFGSPNGLG